MVVICELVWVWLNPLKVGYTQTISVPNSITVSILRFHREDPGSIPGLGDFFALAWPMCNIFAGEKQPVLENRRISDFDSTSCASSRGGL